MGYSTSPDDIARDLAILRSEFDRSKGLISGSFPEGTSPYFDFLRARDGKFDRPIIEAAQIRRDTSQTISSAGGTNFTAINWSSITVNNDGLVIVSTLTNSSRIYLPTIDTQRSELWLISGAFSWETAVSATTGFQRFEALRNYRADDSSIGGENFDMDGRIEAGGDARNGQFNFVWRHNSSDAYFIFYCYNDDTTARAVSRARVSFFKLE